MIERYTRPEMARIWSDAHRLELWLKVETAVLAAFVEEGTAPAEALEAVRTKARIDPARIAAIEAEVKHDVIAFLTSINESVGPLSRFLHRGMTSNDLVDTALALQFVEAGAVILNGLRATIEAVKVRAEEFRTTPCIGRSHGIHAEPITFGIKLAGWYAELRREERRVTAALAEVAVGKIAGAVGVYGEISPETELKVLSSLGLRPETVATQVVARDRHAALFSALALLATSIERMATEVRHLQRTEVSEAEEYFSPGQKGSSAMPHKRNPILSENLCGLARLMRGYSFAALEDVALWHERDISHSSVERVIGPDAFLTMDFMLARFCGVVSKLKVYPERMKENLDASRGLVFSGNLLIALVNGGATREDAYKLVQKHALEAWAGGATLAERLASDEVALKFASAEAIRAVASIEGKLGAVETIFNRAFGPKGDQ